MLKRDLGMGHGDANTIVHYVRSSVDGSASAASSATPEDSLDRIYSGGKEHLRFIHDALMEKIDGFGEFEIAPKKGYVSLRRRKQFAMIGPAAKTRVEVGINMKGVQATERLVALPSGKMCRYKVDVTDQAHVNDELIAWIRQAYEQAE